MAITVYSIEPGKDVHLGTAGDIQTLVSLIDLTTLRPDSSGCSLHGQMGPIGFSGECDPEDAIYYIMSESDFGAHRSSELLKLLDELKLELEAK